MVEGAHLLTYKNPKARPCEVCERLFVPDRMGQVVCSPACAMKKVRQAKVEERAKVRTRKEAIKTLADLKREAQTALNRWIVQVRDADKPCISCGRHHEGQWHAGHYMSRGAAPQHALNPLNVHKQCAPCNTYLHGNLIAYRVRLIELIGLQAVEELEADNAPRKMTRESVIAIRDTYKKKLKELKA